MGLSFESQEEMEEAFEAYYEIRRAYELVQGFPKSIRRTLASFLINEVSFLRKDCNKLPTGDIHKKAETYIDSINDYLKED